MHNGRSTWYYSLSFFVLGLAAPAWASENCEPNRNIAVIKNIADRLNLPPTCTKTFADQTLARGRPIASVLRSLMNSSIAVVAIGEGHTLGAGIEGYGKFLHDLRSSGFSFDCVTVELPVDLQPDIESFLRSHNGAKKGNAPSLGLFSTDTTMPQAIQMARQSHLRAFAVDDIPGVRSMDKALERGDLTALEKILNNVPSLEERNRSMSHQISELIKTGTCKKIVHIGGLQHLSLGHNSEANLSNLLKAEGHRPVTLALQSDSDYGKGKKFVPTALRCEPGTPPFKISAAGTAVASRAIDGPLLGIDADGRPISLWHDFDAVLFLPQH